MSDIDFQRLLNDYWNAAYAEGKECRTHDTKEGVAQRTLSAINSHVESLRQRVEFESRKCSKCGTNLGLLHEDACPLCNCRQQVKVLAKQLKSCLANKWKARCEKAEAELAALKAGQGEPVAYGLADTQLGRKHRMMMVRLDKGQDGCDIPLCLCVAAPKPEDK